MAAMSIVRHAELARQFKGRNIVLALRNEINRQEPGAERQLRLVKQRAGLDRGLTPAQRALKGSPRSVKAIFASQASRAGKAIRPTQPDQLLMALIFSAVTLLKGRPAHALLKRTGFRAIGF